MSGSRLPSGGLIDRDRSLRFTFEGRSYTGFAGDTLASALLANGVSVLGRSFKYHRPRGLLAAGAEEPNALVQLGTGPHGEANPRATEIELYDGLTARAVNCWPSVAFDIGEVNSLVGRFIPVGFYYKTFMWPDWHWFEPFIRRAAGLGRPSEQPDPDSYETRYAHCDVLVVGSGPAGLAAALEAGAGGARVILCEQDNRLGGSLVWDGGEIDNSPAFDWAERAAEILAGRTDTQVLIRTAAVGYFDHNEVALVERVTDHLGPGFGPARPRQRLWQVRAKRVVLATGAFERPLVFPGNDRPGVMLASAVRQYLGRWAVRAGSRAVLFTNNDLAYRTVGALREAGAEVVAVVDSRAGASAARAEAAARGVSIFEGSTIIATRGRMGLSAVKVRLADGREQWLEADLLAVSGGFNPAVQLLRHSGGGLAWDEAQALFKPSHSVQAEVSVGAAAGDLDLASALNGGHGAGADAAKIVGGARSRSHPPKATSADLQSGLEIEPLWRVEARGKAFVDFQNDVSADDVALSAREGFRSVEHLKRYTALGMGTDQGKTSNVNGLALLAALTDRTIPQTGSTLFRFPDTPIPLAVLGGRARGKLFRPLRRLPAHTSHVEAGATFEEYAGWSRPTFYARHGEDGRAAEQREALAVRERVGLYDNSPLGKIEVTGPDAAEFLDRIYANTMSTLKVGRARYGLMLNELGVVIDDGVALRLGEDQFLVGTTSAGAGRIGAWLEEWLQCEWPHLKVLVAPVTSAWAVPTLSGPAAREVLRGAGTDIELSPEAFPHMSFREGEVAGVRARVSRVSFTGETSFEIAVPAQRGAEVWNRLADVGRSMGLEPVGVDAWLLLRTEKGYLHVGSDTDGTTSADDVGWSHIHKRTTDFIGRRSLMRPDNLRPDRLQFVGLERLDASAESMPVGSHLVASNGDSGGYVTSSGFSPLLGRPVALGMVRAGRARHGETAQVTGSGGRIGVRITAPGAYDPKGERLNG